MVCFLCVCVCSKCISYDVVIIFKASWNVLRKCSELALLAAPSLKAALTCSRRAGRHCTVCRRGRTWPLCRTGAATSGHKVSSRYATEQKHRAPVLVLSGRNGCSRLLAPAKDAASFHLSCLSARLLQNGGGGGVNGGVYQHISTRALCNSRQ